MLHAIERSPRDRYASAAEMLADLRDPSQVGHHGRAGTASAQPNWRRTCSADRATALFFVSLIAIFVFLIWLANRYPAAPAAAPNPIAER